MEYDIIKDMIPLQSVQI